MKIISLLLPALCMSAFTIASNSVPVEKGKKTKPAAGAPVFVKGASQTIYSCDYGSVDLTPLLEVTDDDGAPGDMVSWSVTNGADIVADGQGTLTAPTSTPWSQPWAAGGIKPTGVTISFKPTYPAAGPQDIIVQCSDGSASSTTVITVVFGRSPSVTYHPMNQSVCAGATATFMATVIAIPAPTYQWQENGGAGFLDIPGAESASLSMTAEASKNGYQYRMRAYNLCPSFATSNPATLTAKTPPTTIPVFSGNALVKSGGTGTYHAVFYNTGTYAWSFSEPGAVFSGNTQTATANFAGVSADGNVTLRYDNGCGLSPASAPLAVHFVAPPAAVDDHFNALEGAVTISGNVLAANPTTADTYDPLASAVPQVVAAPSEPGTFDLQSDGTFTYTPDNADFNGTVTFTYRVDDAVNTASAPATVTIDIAAVNDAPVITAPASFSINEDDALALSGVSFSDADIDPLSGPDVAVSITAGDDNISLTAAPSGTITVLQTGNDVVLTGTIANINTYIAGGSLVYTPAANYNGAFDLGFEISDLGNTGTPGVLTATANATVTIAAVNDAPIITTPTGTRNVLQTGSLTYDAANLVSVNDVDAGAGNLEFTIAAANGLVTLAGTTGLSFTTGDGTADGTMVFSGNLTDINNALNGLEYTPTSTYSGPAAITLTVSDLGNTGSGGALTVSGSVSINVLSIPRVASVSTSDADKTYKIGDAIGITLTLSEAVTVSGGTPTLTLETGSTDRAALYSGGSGTTLNFTYTVQAGDVSADLDVTGINAISLNGATIENGFGTALNATLPTPGGTGSLSAGHQIAIDGIAPAAPVTATPADGSITNDNIPTYTGTAEINSTVTLYIDGSSVGTATANASGNWTLTPVTPLTDGSHTASATATDAAGNTGIAGNTNTFTVDVTPPAPPVTAAPANGSATNDNTPAYTGTAEPNSIVTVMVDGLLASTATTNASGSWSFTPITPLADGSHSVYATATDAVSNTSPAGNTNTFSVDVTAPAAPVTNTPADGSITNDNTPAYAGTAEINSTVTLYIDGTSVGTATANASGNWMLTPVVPLADGSHTVYATATDAVSNTSAAGNTNTFSVDVTAPAAAVTTTPTDGSITNNNTPAYAGTAEINSTVTLYIDGTSVGTATANASGSWTLTPVVPLPDGNHTAYATATDAAGNTGSAGNTNTFTVDVTPPAPPVTTTPANGSATNDNTPAYTGTAEPNSTVTVMVDGLLAGTVTANTSGSWSFTPITPLAGGNHSVYATATDAASNTSLAGNTNTFTIDVTPPAAPVTTSPANGSITNDNTPAFAGTAEINSTVTVYVDGVSAGTAAADISGNWSFTPATSLADGSHTLYATATDAVSNTSAAGNTNTFTVDVIAPGLTISTTAPSKVNAAFTVTMIFTETVLNFAAGDISVTNGTASALNTSDGITYTALITPVADGAVDVQVNAGVANDAAGNDNTASNTLGLIYDATSPTVTINSTASANVNAPFTATIVFSEDVTGFDITDIAAANAALSSFSVTNAQTYTVLVTPAADGIVTLGVAAAAAQDDAGNGNTAAMQLSRNYDATAPAATVTIAAPVSPAAYIATFTFSEPVTGVDLADLSLSNASAGNFTTVNASTYTAEITPTACTFTVTVITGAAQDATGNTSAVSNTASATQPTPVINISSDKPSKVVASEVVALLADGAVTYQWAAAHGIMSGDNTATLHIAATQTTTYTVTGTNQWGCAGTASYTQEIDATPVAPVIAAPVNGSTISTLSPVISGTAEAGTTITVYIDGSAQGTTPADGTGNWSFTAPALTPGAHTASATATTPLGTTGPQSTAINFTIDNVLPGVTISATAPDATTGIFTATFIFTEPVTGFTAGDITVNGGTLGTFTTVSATEYTAEITPVTCTVALQVTAGMAADIAGNTNTASNTSSTTLPNPFVTITSNKPLKVIANETVTLQASGAATYQWASAPGATGSLTSAQLTIQPAMTTTYTVTGISQFGCTAIATYLQEVDVAPAVPVITTPAESTITSNMRPTISGTADAGSTVTVYLNGIAADTVPVNGTGDWSFTPANDLAEGAYAATATASTPLGTASVHSAAVNFTIDITPPAVTLTVSAADAATGEYTGTFTFSEPVTGFTIGDITASGGSVTAFATVSTSVYTATITPTACTSTLQTAAGTAADAAGNTSSASNTGSVTQQAPAVTITSDKPAIVEEEETVILTASGAVSYQWANASGIVSGQATATLTIEPTVNTTYTVTGTDQFGCTAAAQYTQQVNIIPPAPVIVAPVNNTVTNHPRPTISGTSEADATITVYMDNNSLGTATADAAGAWSFTPAADLADGAHMLTATATNAQPNASPESAAVNISIDRVQPAVTAIATAPDAATGVFEVTFTFSEPVTGFTAADVTHPRSTLNAFTAVSAAEYRISLTPTECATDVSVNTNVAIDQAGNGNAAGNPIQVMQQNPAIVITTNGNGQVSLGETVLLKATGGTHYIWEPAEGVVNGMNTPDLAVRPPADHTYRVAGYNPWGCMTQAEISITVTADYKVDATNVITPNGDGINDRWVVRNINSYPANVLRIFDRTGRLVYEKRNYANEWDGTVSGRPLAEGAYLYVLEIDNGKKTVKGYITLIREKR
ncbi:MAG: Ig-like domain-containing protein [Chitinophaga sp.]